MSLTKTTFSMIEGTPVNVGDFGAVGDGINDDTAAIQAAIDSVPVVNKITIYFEPNKTYRITASITSNSRFLSIEGNNATLALDFNASYVLVLSDGLSTVENLNISKSSGVTADGIFVGSIRNRLDNINLTASAWPKAIHLVDCKESHFSRIRVDNDVSGLTGSIFYSDYSVNNTITQSFLGYCEFGVYFSGLNQPTFGYRSEGFIITDCIFVFCKTVVRAIGITSIDLSNNILDFCIDGALNLSNGTTAFVTNNWIANDASSTSFIACSFGAGFEWANVSNNLMLKNGGSSGSSAISSNATYVKFVNNHLTNGLNAGTVNGSTSYVFGNTLEGGGSNFAGTAPVFVIGNGTFSVPNGFVIGSTTLPGQWTRTGIKEYVDVKTGVAVTGAANDLLFSNYGDVPTMGHIYVQEIGTGDYFIGVWYKQNLAATPVVTLLANNGLTFSSANANGTVTMAGFTTPTNLKYTATIMAVNN
jgi:hypothetical protein